jgi:hypothetical protein
MTMVRTFADRSGAAATDRFDQVCRRGQILSIHDISADLVQTSLGTPLALQNRSIMSNPAPTSKVVLIGSQGCTSETLWFPCPLYTSELSYPHSPEREKIGVP